MKRKKKNHYYKIHIKYKKKHSKGGGGVSECHTAARLIYK